MAWCTNRSGSKIFSINQWSKSYRDSQVEWALVLNQYDIDYPEYPYARKVLNYLSTLHFPTRSSEIRLIQNYDFSKLEYRMTLSDDERILFIFDLVDHRLHILHVEDDFFGSVNLQYQFSTFSIYHKMARDYIERGDGHLYPMYSSEFYLEAIRNQNIAGIKKRLEMNNSF